MASRQQQDNMTRVRSARRERRQRQRRRRGRGRQTQEDRREHNREQGAPFERKIIIPPSSKIQIGSYCRRTSKTLTLTPITPCVVIPGRCSVLLHPRHDTVFAEKIPISVPGGTIRTLDGVDIRSSIIELPPELDGPTLEIRSGTYIVLGPPQAPINVGSFEVTCDTRLTQNCEIPEGNRLVVAVDRPVKIGNGHLWSTNQIVLRGQTLLGGELFVNSNIVAPKGQIQASTHGEVVAISGFGGIVDMSEEVYDKADLASQKLAGDREFETKIRGEFTFLCAGAKLGAGCILAPDTVIPAGTAIPPKTELPPRTVIPQGTVLPEGTLLPKGTKVLGYMGWII
ncbi:hypothetical protein F5B19DRAFT_505211 [Rostrohypoxylon terebratum]|nr:hypothetical protein F5B19DRAFT_505211 [Rostrohypoxylon terebratum]